MLGENQIEVAKAGDRVAGGSVSEGEN